MRLNIIFFILASVHYLNNTVLSMNERQYQIINCDADSYSLNADDSSDSDSIAVETSIQEIIATINSEWTAIEELNDKFGFNFVEDNLYIAAFDVGQANCIILRRGNGVVIVDAGVKYSVIESIISGLFSGYFIGRALRYTYKYLKVAKSL